VAIGLTDTRIYPDADRADEGCLTEVGTESRPEVVVQVRPSVKCAGVKSQPMSYDIEERNEEGNSHHEEKEEKAKSQPLRLATAPGFGINSLPTAVSSLGRRVEGDAFVWVAAGGSGIVSLQSTEQWVGLRVRRVGG